jgi:hypothetical protein
VIQDRATWPALGRMFEWIVEHEQFACLRSVERYRLIGLALAPAVPQDYASFDRLLETGDDPALVEAGRRVLALLVTSPIAARTRKLEHDVDLFVQARDYYSQQADNWRREAEHWRAEAERLASERGGVGRTLRRGLRGAFAVMRELGAVRDSSDAAQILGAARDRLLGRRPPPAGERR